MKNALKRKSRLRKLTVYGDCPSKKNTRIFNLRGRHPISLPGKVYSIWHKEASRQLLGEEAFVGEIKQMRLTFFPRTQRKSDLTNRAESVMDLLVDCGVIPDDNWFVVPRIELVFGGVDKQKPRAEVEII